MKFCRTSIACRHVNVTVHTESGHGAPFELVGQVAIEAGDRGHETDLDGPHVIGSDLDQEIASVTDDDREAKIEGSTKSIGANYLRIVQCHVSPVFVIMWYYTHKLRCLDNKYLIYLEIRIGYF